MKRKNVLIVSFILFLLSVFLPWFTFNPKVMGYRWGFLFLPYMIVPIAVIAMSAFVKRRKPFIVLSELSLLSVLSVYVMSFGRWQEYCNIATGFRWSDGFYTATVGYWLSLGLFLVFALLYQVWAWGRETVE